MGGKPFALQLLRLQTVGLLKGRGISTDVPGVRVHSHAGGVKSRREKAKRLQGKPQQAQSHTEIQPPQIVPLSSAFSVLNDGWMRSSCLGLLLYLFLA